MPSKHKTSVIPKVKFKVSLRIKISFHLLNYFSLKVSELKLIIYTVAVFFFLN